MVFRGCPKYTITHITLTTLDTNTDTEIEFRTGWGGDGWTVKPGETSDHSNGIWVEDNKFEVESISDLNLEYKKIYVEYLKDGKEKTMSYNYKIQKYGT